MAKLKEKAKEAVKAKELEIKDAKLDGSYVNVKGNAVEIVKKNVNGSAIALVSSSKPSRAPEQKLLPAEYKLIEKN